MICDVKVVNRIKRVSGQVIGILAMIEENRDCQDLIMQLKAARSSLDKTIKLLAVNNLIQKIETEEKIVLKNIDKEIETIINS